MRSDGAETEPRKKEKEKKPQPRPAVVSAGNHGIITAPSNRNAALMHYSAQQAASSGNKWKQGLSGFRLFLQTFSLVLFLKKPQI